MRKIISTFIKFPFYANLIIGFIVIGGWLSLNHLKKSFFPEISSRLISISVFYPGASPIEMEEGVTSRIEEAVRSIVGIKEITSLSSENSSRVTIEITGQYDIDETLMEVKTLLTEFLHFRLQRSVLLSLNSDQCPEHFFYLYPERMICSHSKNMHIESRMTFSIPALSAKCPCAVHPHRRSLWKFANRTSYVSI